MLERREQLSGYKSDLYIKCKEIFMMTKQFFNKAVVIRVILLRK